MSKEPQWLWFVVVVLVASSSWLIFFSDFRGLEETCNQPQDPSGHTVRVCAGPQEGLAASDFVELAQHHAGRGFHGTSRGELRPATGGFFWNGWHFSGWIIHLEDIYLYTAITLWLFNIAMEHGPFIDDFPIKASIYKGFSTAMLNNQRVSY